LESSHFFGGFWRITNKSWSSKREKLHTILIVLVCSQLIAPSSSTSPVITYAYNTKASEIGDYWQIIQLINYGASFIRTAHQLAGYSYTGTVENINYTYDNTGKISAVTGTNGGTVENIAYQYSCNQDGRGSEPGI
jgi:hypothetical protein